MSAQVPSDEELFARYRRGDARAFEELYRRYRRPVYGFIYRFVSDPETAAELHQEVFLKVIRGAADFEERSKFSTWLYRITRNLCVDRLRRMSHRKTVSLDQPGDPDGRDDRSLSERVEDPSGDVERQVVHGRLREALARAVAGLPEEQREVFLLREVSGLSYKEISEVVGCPENTAKSRMRYALERLRQSLSEWEAVAEEAGRVSPWGRR